MNKYSYYSLRNKIGFKYWDMLQKRYKPIQDKMIYISEKNSKNNKILRYICIGIDVSVFIISYIIIRICGLRM